MKKRLLALCLAAALLVSLAPVLNLSTGVSAAKADIVVQDKLIDKANEVVINSTTYNNSDVTHAPNGSGTGLYLRTTSSTTGWAEYENLVIDHTKTVEWFSQIQFNVFNDKGDVNPCYVSEGGAIARNSCWSFILNDSDAENGGFVLPFMYSSNQKLYLQFLMPGSSYGNDIYSEAIDLGATYSATNGGKFDGRYELKLVWLPNGDVEVWFNVGPYVASAGGFVWAGEELKATVKNATWAHGTASEPTIYGNNDKSAADYDFILHGLHYSTDQSVYVWDTSITSYSTYAEALLTGETINADNKLDELSWKYAAWEEIAGDVTGEAAVLMKNGEAYVALKSAAATSATVTLGDNTKENVAFVNGVAELKFEDASIDSLKETLAYSVTVTDGTKTGAVDAATITLNSRKVNDGRTGTGITMKNTEYAGVTNGTNWTASHHSDFVNNSRLANSAFLAVTGTNNPALAINHNNDIYIEWHMWVDIMAVSDGLITDTGSAVNKSEGFYFQAQDSEGSAVIHAIIYRADAAGNLKARVLKADKTCSDPIDLGITVENAEGAARVGFLWATDGSVSVLVNGEVKGVVDDASITAAKSTYLAPNSTDRVFFQNVAAEWATFFLYGYSFLNVTGEPMDVVTQQVAIGDDLSFNFATNVGAGTASATVNGQAVEADAEGNISINLAAAQMNDVVELTVADDSGMTVTKEYTVRDYALTILNDNTGAYDEVKPLVEAMLHYGAAAQTYFEYNDDALVTDGLNLTAPTAAPVAGTAANITDGGLSDLGIKYYGASLLFKNKTTLRFYFEVEGDIAAAAFYIGGPSGTPVTPKQSGESNFYYIDIVDINPQDLDNQVTIFATDVEYGGMLSASVTYSPANYMVNIYNSANSSAALKQLMVAMYNYNLAANAYVA